MPRSQDDIARAVAEDMLEITRQALLNRTADAFCDLCHLPLQVGTPEGMVTIHQRDKLEAIFLQVCDTYARNGVTDLDRYCEAVIMKTPDTIETTHVSHHVIDGKRDPVGYPVFSVLKNIDGAWKAVFTDNGLPPNSDYSYALLGKHCPDQPAAKDPLEEIVLDVMTGASRAFLEGDFDQWEGLVHYPLMVESTSGRTTFPNTAALRKDFDLYQSEFQIHAVTDIIREFVSARALSTNRIVGTYRTHVLSHARPIVPPWTASVTLIRTEKTWRIESLHRILGHLNWSVPNPAPNLDTPHTTPKMGD